MILNFQGVFWCYNHSFFHFYSYVYNIEYSKLQCYYKSINLLSDIEISTIAAICKYKKSVCNSLKKMCPIWKCVYVTWAPIVAYANIPIYILWVPFDVHAHDNKMVSLHKERLIRSWWLLQLLPLLIIQMSLEVAHAGNERDNP